MNLKQKIAEKIFYFENGTDVYAWKSLSKEDRFEYNDKAIRILSLVRAEIPNKYPLSMMTKEKCEVKMAENKIIDLIIERLGGKG